MPLLSRPERPFQTSALLGSFALLLIAPTTLSAQSDGPRTIYPATKIDAPKLDAIVVSFLNVFQVLEPDEDEQATDRAGTAPVNFFFASGSGSLAGERTSPAALPLFDAAAVAELAEIRTNTEVCYVQNFRLTNERITIAIHDERTGGYPYMMRCLVGGLWMFERATLDGYDSDDWRGSFVKLLQDRL